MLEPLSTPLSRERVTPYYANSATFKDTVVSLDGDIDQVGDLVHKCIVGFIDRVVPTNLHLKSLTITVEELLAPIDFKFVHDGRYKQYVWHIYPVANRPNKLMVIFEDPAAFI